MNETTSYEDAIYTGVWINKSFSQIRGATLTLSREHGSLLIAFLALFVATAGSSFWKITRYILHLYFSKEADLDGVYHQRQAILRNDQLASDAAMSLISARFAWRRRAKHLNRKLLFVAALALLISATFMVSGIFSSTVTAETGNEVLLTGKHCGNLTQTWSEDIEWKAKAWTEYFSAQSQKASEYLTYVNRCYKSPGASLSDECKIYAKPSLPYTTDRNATCPFDPEVCTLPRGNLLLDTGYLDSYEYLGLNDGPRFQFQLRRHCAPLKTQGYTTTVPDETNPATSWLEYNYGASSNGILPVPYTYRLRPKNSTDVVLSWDDLLLGDDYRISSPNDYQPIPQMNKTNGSVSLLFMQSSRIKYYAPVLDPWFLATTPAAAPSWLDLGLTNNTYYIPDEPAQVLGCTTKMQFCNPDMPANSNCWNTHAARSVADIWPNKEDQNVMNGYIDHFETNFAGTIGSPQFYYTLNSLSSLKTRFTLNGLMQPAIIPNGRWQEETSYIFQTNLAAAQARVVEHGQGGLFGGNQYGTLCGVTKECQRRCYNQKIRSARYNSFSILGMSIIIGVGALLVLIGSFIEPFVNLVAKIPFLARSRRLTYARLEWQANSILQLQRVAQESVGMGTWSRTGAAVPVTERGEVLATWDISDTKHSRLFANRGARGMHDNSAPYTYGGEPGISKTQIHHSVTEVDRGTHYSRLSMNDRI
ncbi:hypothetical protein BKA66DRAFT_544411 [Pyrenochaeta sp. MPI-SDFR-AT-0127]|nr:hypothetical protein BKA66DRAFT_544411 [Pyrenochaeta sp. MPI-SDFR-AT-0127]